MKHSTVVLLTISVFLVSACNPLSPAVNMPEGEVVSCAEIIVTDNPTVDLKLDCLDGASNIDLADLKGPAIVNFWGSWCGPCRDEIPYFTDLNNSLPEGLILIGVDREELNKENAVKFIKDFGVTYPQLADPTGASKALVGTGIPVTIFIDSTGTVVHKHVGAITSTDQLRELVLKHLNL